jgi:hypothetical protein
MGNIIPDNWYSVKLKSIANPVSGPVEVEVDVIKKSEKVIILNTLDFVYGHSLLYLFNLQRLIREEKRPDIIVIVQPMLRWLVPRSEVAEIWTVKLDFPAFRDYYPDLSEKLNRELERFKEVYISQGHILPTNTNIQIEKFTGIYPFDFENKPVKTGITFIWREDPDRLWIKNYYLLKGIKKLGLSRMLLPFHLLRVIRLFRLVRKRLGGEFTYSVAGLGKSFKMPSFIEDHRVVSFNEENERQLCRIYAESGLVIGVHGSAMLLPSAHAGMVVSLMPSKRWGNFAEDVLYIETDVRLAAFQRRIIPSNICIADVRDIVIDMITGRDYFIKKFLHDEEL